MKKAIIIGAGPAGLTAAYELLKRTDIKPIIYEATNKIGGISQTVEHNGNRMDIGGHRFFSKSDRVMNFWKEILPIEDENVKNNKKSAFMIRNRLSRIFFLKKFFDYPITLSTSTIKNLGIVRMMKIGHSYIKVRIFPIRKEKNLEDFYINRFGKELYNTFFKDYTYKVWGVPCDKLPSDWGAQRVKGLSITKAIIQALKPKKHVSIDQKNVETSLIEKFMYPKYGPGQFWEELAKKITDLGGEVHLNSKVIGTNLSDDKITNVMIEDTNKNKTFNVKSDYVFSTMPVKDLIMTMKGNVPRSIVKIAKGLVYRDFMTVGLLLKDVLIKDSNGERLKDNWIYIQEKDVNVGRIQIFNNWSPYMVSNKSNIFIGMEYFVNEGDKFWTMKDSDFADFAISEMEKMGFIKKEDVIDSIVIRMPKSYPAYLGTYDKFDEIIKFTNNIENIFLIGRNGMHRYNNSDHSSLSAMTAVDNIVNNIKDKTNIWEVNVEKEYHESK